MDVPSRVAVCRVIYRCTYICMKLVINERIINHVVDQLINNGVEQ